MCTVYQMYSPWYCTHVLFTNNVTVCVLFTRCTPPVHGTVRFSKLPERKEYNIQEKLFVCIINQKQKYAQYPHSKYFLLLISILLYLTVVFCSFTVFRQLIILIKVSNKTRSKDVSTARFSSFVSQFSKQFQHHLMNLIKVSNNFFLLRRII